MTNSGKKLNFMGNEFAQGREWNVNNSLDWHLINPDLSHSYWHRGVQQACRDLNYLYKENLALHDNDFESFGFEWIDCQDMDQSIISFVRRARNGEFVIVVLNFTPVLRTGYRLGVPQAGQYIEIFNSDAECYSGSNQGNGWGVNSEPVAWMNLEKSIIVTLPPLAGIILKLK
jgi:1,4-alpha-glucan branching enzyme